MRTLGIVALSLLASANPGSAATELSVPERPVNMSFEQPAAGENPYVCPDHWFWFSSTPELFIGVTDRRAKDGLQSCRLRGQSDEEAYQGIAQRFKASPGQEYTFSVFVMNDRKDPIIGASYGQISLEWQDEAGQEISRDYGPAWHHELRFDAWTRFVVEAKAPDHAVMGVVVITFFSRNSGGYGTFYIDDCDFDSRSGPAR